MALTEKLTAIADAIRSKTGKTDGLTLEQMPGEIAGIQAGGGAISASNELAEAIATIVEVGANTVTTLSTAKAYFQGLLGTTADVVCMILIGDYGNINNELIVKDVASGFIRWRDGAVSYAGDHDGYDLRLAEGQHYLVFAEMRKT